MSDLKDTDKFFFHAIAPCPTCCGKAMSLRGNLSLQVLRYECVVCRQLLRVSAKFEYDDGDELTDEMRDTLDSVP